MSQEEIIGKINEVTILLNNYYIEQDKNNTIDFDRDLCSEVSSRINKLKYIFERISYIELEFKKFQDTIVQKITSKTFKDNMFRDDCIEIYNPLELELEILTECFYHIAWRIVDILKNGWLPGIKIKDIKGISDVRNHLLQHPERHGRVLINSFGYGGINGPTIKAARYSEQENLSPDKGLYANLEELLNKLITGIKNES